MIDKKALGAAIKQMRVARGITQVELAEAVGLSKSGNTVALIERGQRGVSLDTLNDLASALDIPSGCLALLGTTPDRGNKSTAKLVKSLQKLITSTVTTQSAMRLEERQGKMQTSAKSRAVKRKGQSKVRQTSSH